MLPCLGPVVLALRIGSYHGGLAPFYRYSIVGDKFRILVRFSLFALEPFFELLPILLPRIARIIVINRFDKNFIDKGLLPDTPIQIKNGRHIFLKSLGFFRRTSLQLDGSSIPGNIH